LTVHTTDLDSVFNRLGSPDRMRHLAGYDLFAPRLADHLDPICADTAARLNAPVSLVSVILDTAQYIIGGHGVGGWVHLVQGTPAEWALCTHTVLTGEPYCVSDASTDPEHRDNPLLGSTGLHSYAGVPLVDGSGHVIGSHCVLDVAARTFTDDDLEVLQDGARRAMQHLNRPSPSA
jgi:GAF domain-containing protein